MELSVVLCEFEDMEDPTPRQGAVVPVMSPQRFAEFVGMEDGIVRRWIERGQLPTVKIGRHRLVNLALLQDDCLKGEDYQ